MKRLKLALAFGAGTVALVPVAIASAADIKYSTESASAAPGDQKRVRTACPGGYLITGGAGESSGSYQSGYVSSLGPLDGKDNGAVADDAWGAYIDAYAPVVATATVACVDGRAARGLDYVVQPQPVSSGERAKIKAKCPKGSRVTGGGAMNDVGYSQIEVLGSYPSSDRRSWVADIRIFGFSDLNLRSFAVCASGGFAKGLVYKSRTRTVDRGRQGRVDNICPKKTSAVGGGASVQKASANLVSAGITSIGDGSVTTADAAPDGKAKITNYLVCSK